MGRRLVLESLEPRRLLSSADPLAIGIGGSSWESAYDGVVDASGNVYVTGSLYSDKVDFDPGPERKELVGVGGFIVKYSAEGDYLWARKLGGQGLALALDSTDENVYVTGSFAGTASFGDRPEEIPADMATLTSDAGSDDVFIAKLDAETGSFASKPGTNTPWIQILGGSLDDRAWDITVDPFGNVITAGFFAGIADFDPSPAVALLSSTLDGDLLPSQDIFVCKLTSDGEYVWAEKMGGPVTGADERASGVDADREGGVYVTGRFVGAAHFGTQELIAKGSMDIFVAKFFASGGLAWVRRAGSEANAEERGFGLMVDDRDPLPANWSICVSGQFNGSADFGSTILNSINTDAFVAKLNALTGTFLWAKQLSGSGQETAYRLTLDGVGNIYTAGSFFRGDPPVSDFDPGPGTRMLVTHHYREGFVSKLDSDGNYLAAWQSVSTGDPSFYWVAMGANGLLYGGGASGGNVLFPQLGQPLELGEYDACVFRINPAATSVSGIVFLDIDGDGIRDVEPEVPEPGLGGWTVFLDVNANGILDGEEIPSTTDSRGCYHFNLLPGTYTVALAPKNGWTQTSPSAFTVLVDGTDPSLPVSSGDFGNYALTSRAEYSSSNTPLILPVWKTSRSTIAISESYTIADLDVEIDVTAAEVYWLAVSLIAPDGTTISLFPGGNPDGMSPDGARLAAMVFDCEANRFISAGVSPYTGRFKPSGQWWFSESLCDLYGTSIQGNWTLEVYIENPGTLNYWKLHVTKLDSSSAPWLCIDNASVAEGDSGASTATFTLSLSRAFTEVVTVSYATADNTAIAGSDYTATSGTLTFNPGETTNQILVTILGDTLDEEDETFYVNLSNPSPNVTIADGQGMGTIIDDDSAAIRVTPTSGLITDESGRTAEFTVVLNTRPTAEVTMSFSSDHPSEGSVAPATLVFTSGDWDTPQTVTVTGVNDFIDDGNVAYTIITAAAVSQESNYNGLDPADVSVTNLDNDTAAVVLIESDETTEVVEGGATESYTVVLASQPLADVTVQVIHLGDQVETLPAALLFTSADWNVPQTVAVRAFDDDVAEGLHTALIGHFATSTDPKYQTAASLIVWIHDNDTAAIHVAPTSALITSEVGGTATFTVVLNSRPTADVTIDLSSSNPGEGTVAPADLVFTPATWNHSQTVTVTGVNDFVADGAVEYTIITAAATSEDPMYDGLDAADVSVTNFDTSLVNDPPSFIKGPDQSMAEDGEAQSVIGWAADISAGPADEFGQALAFLVSTDNDELFFELPWIDPAGTLRYTPAADAFGLANVAVRLKDDGGTENGGMDTSAPQTFTITVRAVNDVPSFLKGPDRTIDEDAPRQIVAGWATAVSAGPENEAGQKLASRITTDNDALFAEMPTIDPATGTLCYTPGDDAFGSTLVTVWLEDDGGTEEGGTDTSEPQSFTITIRPVNDPPTLTPGPNQVIAEDAGPQTITGWATVITAGPANEAEQKVTLVTSTDNDGLFAQLPTVDPATGTLCYTPAADAFGLATVTMRLEDDGGTDNGGLDFTVRQFTIQVLPVNDTPTFAAGADPTVREDAGPQSIASWATAISAGPANEAGQTLTFLVATDNDSLFAALPAIDPLTGSLTFTPAANAFGSAVVTVRLQDNGGTAGGGQNTSAPQPFTIHVSPVNDPPAFAKGANQTVNEDAGPRTVNGWAGGISRGPANEAAQRLTFHVSSDNDELFAEMPAIDPESGALKYTPAADASGSAMVTVWLADDGGTADGGVDISPLETFRITVQAVNDAPSFNKGADQIVDEDAGPQSVAGWATGLSAGPPDEAGQSLTFLVSTNKPGLFAVQPSVHGATGALSFKTASNAFGTATVTVRLKDSGGTANGGIDTSPSQTFVITVNPVNDVPSFTKGPNLTVKEDAGPQTFARWATGIARGAANEAAQLLTFLVDTDNDGLFAALPEIDPATGNLAYTTAANAFGSATVTIRLKDNGGTANGGIDTSPGQTFTITVDPVNDAPSFLKGISPWSNEDAGPQAVVGWATGISVGAANEAGQMLTFQVATSNDGLFSELPSIDPVSGALRYTAAPDAFGDANITVCLRDNGGTARGGADASASQTFVIHINPVNDAPFFTKGPNIIVDEDDAEQSFVQWATTVRAGPLNEAGQALWFWVDADNDALFAVPPAVNLVNGTLTFTPAPEAYGMARVAVRLHDGGGGMYGGVPYSPVETFTIIVRAVNDAPSFLNGPDQTVDEDSPEQIITGWAQSIAAGPGNESGQTLAFRVETDNEQLFAVLPAVDPDSGTLSYTPADNAFGTATVAVSLKDNGGTANGGVDASVPQTFRITIDPVNDAPVLCTEGRTPLLSEIDEDDFSNPGTLVQTILASVAPLDLVTDIDPDALEGVAVIGLNADNGEWQYSINGGANWSRFGEVSDELACLLASDSQTRIRFVPNPDYVGSSAIRIRAWDRTWGAGGGIANTTTHGGVTAFSTGTIWLSISVLGVNDPPTGLVTIDDTTPKEDQRLTASNTLADADGLGTITYTWQRADNAAFDSGVVELGTGSTFTPGDADVGKYLRVMASYTDGHGTLESVASTVTGVVANVNDAPALSPIEDQAVNEQTSLALQVSATDQDHPQQTLTYSLNQAAIDLGMSIDLSTGEFRWTPTEAQGGASYQVTITVTDDGEPALEDSETFTITVAEVNVSPVLPEIGNRGVDEQSLLSFTATATDQDVPAQGLMFSLDAASLAAGMWITSSGEFSWTPTEAQGGADYTVTITVSDDGQPALSDFETFTVSVGGVNAAPLLDAIGDRGVDEQSLLSFTATATDQDLPAHGLMFNLDAASIAAGMTITPSGEFSWTPTEAQGGADYTVTITVTDDGQPALSDSETFTITVAEVNVAPVLTAIDDRAVDEQSLLSFTATATDRDLPAQGLTFSLDAASVAAGMSITPSGEFTWTPTEAQGGEDYTATITVTDDGQPALSDSETFTITVAEVNVAPVLNTIGGRNVDEQALLSFTATATDQDLPAQGFTFRLDAASIAAGMSITTSGEFSWTPTEAQGGADYTATIIVTDDDRPALSDSETFTITVAEVNVAPMLDAIGNCNVDEQSLLSFTATATDQDLPAQRLTFSLDAASLAAGMTITPSGEFTWKPTASQSGEDYQVTITVTDDGMNPDSLSASETFTITVTPPATVDLGAIDYRAMSDLDLGAGTARFRLETSQEGILTLQACSEAVALTLYDAAMNPLSEVIGRIDHQAPDAGRVYYVDVAGSGLADLIAVNLVRHVGTAVAVNGTPGGDTFVFDASSADRLVTINGVAYPFTPAQAAAFRFDGLDGGDHVRVLGSDSPETATVRPTSGIFEGQGYTLEAANIESAEFQGGESDTVTIWGSRETETYTAEPGRGRMTGENVSIDVTAETIYARGYGGGDTVYFKDGDGDDMLEYFTWWARMRGEGYFHHVRGFSTMRANAELGQNGTDKVVVRGSELNDYFKVNPYNADGQTVARFLSGSGSIWHIAFGFDTIVGYGRGGGIIDQLVLDDTPGADTFQLERLHANLDAKDYGITVTTHGFGTVEARRAFENENADRVDLYDAPHLDHNDTLVGDPTQVTMTGPGYSNNVYGFPLVMAYSNGKGYDTAHFSDLADPNDSRTGVDTFTGRPIFATLEGSGYRLYARLFDEVHAESKYGLDIANLHGNANGAELTATATEVRLSGTHSSGSYANHARLFHEVNAFGTSDADKAVLTGAAVDLNTYSPPADVVLDELAQLLWLDNFEKIERWDSSKADDVDNIDQVFAWWE